MTRPLIDQMCMEQAESDAWAEENQSIVEDAFWKAVEDGEDIVFGSDDSSDIDFLPKIQRGLVICTCLALVERLLKGVCEEVDPRFERNGKGSYVQQYSYFIRSNTTIKIDKEFLKSMESFGHLRNSFLHSLDEKVPLTSRDRLNSMTGIFADLDSGVSGIHVELCLRILNEFGASFQASYWNDYESKHS